MRRRHAPQPVVGSGKEPGEVRPVRNRSRPGFEIPHEGITTWLGCPRTGYLALQSWRLLRQRPVDADRFTFTISRSSSRSAQIRHLARGSLPIAAFRRPAHCRPNAERASCPARCSDRERAHALGAEVPWMDSQPKRIRRPIWTNQPGRQDEASAARPHQPQRVARDCGALPLPPPCLRQGLRPRMNLPRRS